MLTFVKMDGQAVLGQRFKGASLSMFLKKGVLRQAPAFAVQVVKILEQVRLYSDRSHHRAITGHFLFCIFSCARWAGSMNVIECRVIEHQDIVLVEAETKRRKTSMTKEAKTRLLPYTAVGWFSDRSS